MLHHGKRFSKKWRKAPTASNLPRVLAWHSWKASLSAQFFGTRGMPLHRDKHARMFFPECWLSVFCFSLMHSGKHAAPLVLKVFSLCVCTSKMLIVVLKVSSLCVVLANADYIFWNYILLYVLDLYTLRKRAPCVAGAPVFGKKYLSCKRPHNAHAPGPPSVAGKESYKTGHTQWKILRMALGDGSIVWLWGANAVMHPQKIKKQ